MSEALRIELVPERLDEGAPEERTTFGHFTVSASGRFLTEGFDCYLNGYRTGPLVAGNHVAEWFAWNWWRLRWEPRSTACDWIAAHSMASIGESYVWPNITMFSDGLRTALVSRPSSRPDAKPFRYLGSFPIVVPSAHFESAVDAFQAQILGRLRSDGLLETNLDRLWADILAERADPDIAKRRRLEALLGRDPDSIEDDVIDGLLADAERLGEQALDEVAANVGLAKPGQAVPMTAADFEALARAHGHDASPRNAVTLGPGTRLPGGADVPAWSVGVAAAQALRDEQSLGVQPIGDGRLADMGGTVAQTLLDLDAGGADFSFALDGTVQASRIVLRSRWQTGRRFDLARLIGDRLIARNGSLHPATRSDTYRQKAQRAFAAELLSPFEAVDDMLAGDYSEERCNEVAEHFAVSPMTIEALLMNNGRTERVFPEEDFDVPAA